MSSTRIRHSLQHIQYLYDSGEDRSKLENLIRAFRGIQALPPGNPNSFFHIAGLHGLPYRGPGETDEKSWWGGYCWHRTVLFPTWHRAYLLCLENALRSIPHCQDVTLPFWDELLVKPGTPNPPNPPFPTLPIPSAVVSPIPSVLTSPSFELDGRNDNPLYSYKLQHALVHKAKDKNERYSKHEGYETVRYPLSGLVGTEKDRKGTEAHNARFTSQAQNTEILNSNVTQWLLGTVDIPDDGKSSRPDTYSVAARFWRCLSAPNYTVFSNVASQNQWIKEHSAPSHGVVSLESPHNAIHLAVGGFYEEGDYNASPIRGANGDMGDNETAGFDPIFFFHHCFIDYVFAVWQRLWHRTKRGSLTVIPKYDGTILLGGQPPNFGPGTQLDMTTPLLPFEKLSGGYYTSDDVTDLNDLGIAYGTGSLDKIPLIDVHLESSQSPFDFMDSQLLDSIMPAGSNQRADPSFPLTKWVHDINRTRYQGSFVVRLYALGYDGKEVEVGREPVLSRWNVQGCVNCQSHLDVGFYVPIDATTLEYFQGPNEAAIGWRVEIQTHDELHKFPPIRAPGPGHHIPAEGGEPQGPKVDDL